jgi:hypothetical protein
MKRKWMKGHKTWMKSSAVGSGGNMKLWKGMKLG